MRVLLYGITGFTGGNLARELVARGHDVIGVARRIGTAPIPDQITEVTGSVFDADGVAALSDGVDAIVVAVSPRSDDGDLASAVPGLLAAADAAGARLAVVGGASSLSREEGGPRLIDGDFPEAWRDDALALIAVLDALRASGTDVDWFFLSPAEHYGAYTPGERRGTYRTGGDVLVVDDEGRSHIGGEDFATALVDELEHPVHHRMRFTVGY